MDNSAKQDRKEKLRELMAVLEVKDVSDINTLFKEMVEDILENGLEAGMDEELGYSKNQIRKQRLKQIQSQEHENEFW